MLWWLLILLSWRVWKLCSVWLWMTTLKWLPSLCQNHQPHSGPFCRCISPNTHTYTQAHTLSRPTRYKRLLFSSWKSCEHSCLIKQQQNKKQRRPSLSSKLCVVFRSLLIKTRSSFMVSASVYRVFLDKCQLMTFFDVIYSAQKADAAPASIWWCSQARWSFTAIIPYIFNLSRTCTDLCNTRTQT